MPIGATIKTLIGRGQGSDASAVRALPSTWQMVQCASPTSMFGLLTMRITKACTPQGREITQSKAVMLY